MNLELLRQYVNYNPDTGKFTGILVGKRFGRELGLHDLSGYIRIKINKKKYLAHRLAWLWVYGELPELDIDHVNGKRSDNKILNLRLATTSQNQQNRKVNNHKNKHNIAGVVKSGNRFRSQVMLNGESTHLGCFATAEEAGEVYLKAKKEMHEYWERG